jgi:hypothetical protein
MALIEPNDLRVPVLHSCQQLSVVNGQENFVVGQGEQIGGRILTLLFPPADYLSNRGINDGGKVHQTPGMLLSFPPWEGDLSHTSILYYSG